MKIRLLSLALLWFSITQSQNLLWEKSFGGRQADYLSDVLATADNGFIVAGSSLSGQSGTKFHAGQGDLDFCVWKMDENGTEKWQKSYGGVSSDYLKSIRHTSDGGFILGGISQSPVGKDKIHPCRGGNDFWIIKLDASGNEMWQKTIGGNGQDDLLLVCPSRDGGYIAAGSSDSGANGEKSEKSRGNMDYWIVKLSKDGIIEWQHTYGGRYADLMRSLAVTTDGGMIVGGYSNSPEGGDKWEGVRGEGGDFWILKLDEKGDIEWQNTIGGEDDDQLYSIQQTFDKGYLVGGNSISGPSGNKSKGNKKGADLWVLKLDDTGFVRWQDTYNFGQHDVLTSMVENPDHTILIGGYTQSSAGDKGDEYINDYVALKINEVGEVIWQGTVGSAGEDILSGVVETADGGYLFAGTSNPEAPDYIHEDSAGGKSTPSVSIGGDGNLAVLDRAQEFMDEKINGVANSVNDFVDDKVANVTDRVNDKIGKAIGQKEDSKVKFGINAPTGKLMNIGKPGGGEGLLDGAGDMLANKGPKPGLSTSRDKKTNYGKNDLWVVKLGDKNKAKKIRESLQAVPNPVFEYTNLIINFTYTKGTVSVYDISGRPLTTFQITGDSTVPINMSSYPEGLYIIKAGTNNGEGSVKVIKGFKK